MQNSNPYCHPEERSDEGSSLYPSLALRMTVIVLLTFFPLFPFPFSLHLVAAHEESSKVVVHITDQGFDPSSLEIKQGEVVIFENISSSPRWPASNLHPTHQIYPEFDPKAEIPPGQSWQFKFEKTGAFKFHDHVYPTMVGEIKVVGSETTKKISLKEKLVGLYENFKITFEKIVVKIDSKQLDKKLNSYNLSSISYKDEANLNYLIKLTGPQKLLDKLLKDTNNGNSIDCHQQAHLLGNIAYKNYGYEVFKTSSQSCHSGFIHGAMESFLKEIRGENLSSEIEKLCDSFKTDFSQFECLHGVGHGVLAYLNYDLPKALVECQSLKDSFAIESCFGGVFMENIIIAQNHSLASPTHKTTWVSSDPQFPCSSIDQNQMVQYQCYLMQTSRMLDIFQYDFAKVSKECSSLKENLIHTCFQSLGRDSAGQTLRDPVKINQICSIVPKENYSDCLRGGLFVIIDFWGVNMNDYPHQLCRVVANKQDKKYCYRMIGSRLPGMFGQDSSKIKEICSLSEEDYKNECLAISGIN